MNEIDCASSDGGCDSGRDCRCVIGCDCGCLVLVCVVVAISIVSAMACSCGDGDASCPCPCPCRGCGCDCHCDCGCGCVPVAQPTRARVDGAASAMRSESESVIQSEIAIATRIARMRDASTTRRRRLLQRRRRPDEPRRLPSRPPLPSRDCPPVLRRRLNGSTCARVLWLLLSSVLLLLVCFAWLSVCLSVVETWRVRGSGSVDARSARRPTAPRCTHAPSPLHT